MEKYIMRMQCFQKIVPLCCSKDSLENAVKFIQSKISHQNSNGNYNKISNGLIVSSYEQGFCDYGKTFYSNILDGKQIYVSGNAT
jgi:hypothetical protein